MANFNNFNDVRPTDLTSFLSNEIIQSFGVPVYYLRKTLANLDRIFGDDDLQKYENAVELSLLPENPSSFGGSGENFGNLGLDIVETMTMFSEISNFQTITGLYKPEAHDLVYIPIFNDWFEITYTDNDSEDGVFYWNGKVACFTIELLKFQYSHETITTGVAEVDNNAPDETQQTVTDNDIINDEYEKNGLLDEFERLLDS